MEVLATHHWVSHIYTHITDSASLLIYRQIILDMSCVKEIVVPGPIGDQVQMLEQGAVNLKRHLRDVECPISSHTYQLMSIQLSHILLS